MRASIVAAVLLLASCGPPARSDSAPATEVPADAVAVASAPPSGSASPVATPLGGTRPLSAGAVPDAGVLYVQGSDDQIYRYDGLSGRLDPVSGKSSFAHETPFGAQIVGRHGSADLLRWDGKIESAICGPGTVVAISASGSCAYRGDDGSLLLRLRGEAAPRVALPADWGAGSVDWSPDGRRLALTRSLSGGTLATRAHNALWLLDTDGSTRELYRPPGDEAFVFSPRWSRDGIYVSFWRQGIVSASVTADGDGLFLVHVATAGLSDLGTALVHPEWLQWSSDGKLAFVRGGGRETWMGKQIVVRERDGTERVASAADRSALAPAWQEGLGRLAWVEAASGDGLKDAQYMNGTGFGDRRAVIASTDATKREIRCGAPPGESSVGSGASSSARVVEGVRGSLDGTALLLLCRIPGRDPSPLEVWLYRMNGTSPAAVPLVTKLSGGSVPGDGAGFGFYGAQPSLFSLVAWSRAVVP